MMSSTPTSSGLDPDPFYEVAYAYPRSPAAVKTGYGAEGCYLLKIGTAYRGYQFEIDAMVAAKRSALSCGRWSIDHPLNTKIRYIATAAFCLRINAGTENQFETGAFSTVGQAETFGQFCDRKFTIMIRLSDGTVTAIA